MIRLYIAFLDFKESNLELKNQRYRKLSRKNASIVHVDRLSERIIVAAQTVLPALPECTKIQFNLSK